MYSNSLVSNYDLVLRLSDLHFLFDVVLPRQSAFGAVCLAMSHDHRWMQPMSNIYLNASSDCTKPSAMTDVQVEMGS